MRNTIQSVTLDKLIAHPDNPNRQSKSNFAKLVRNIERSGRYEPIVVRPHPEQNDCFQIINGHHRYKALAKLGYKTADCVVWDVDNKQTDILLATLNRLSGSDELGKKLALLKRLNSKINCVQLSKLLPQTAKQIERLTCFKIPREPAKANEKTFANPLVFFANDSQQQTIEQAISLTIEPGSEMSRAAKRSAALVQIAKFFIANSSVKGA
jgi:ParB/RepB/Spo0J family partition protein